jgi:hypothetical protein
LLTLLQIEWGLLALIKGRQRFGAVEFQPIYEKWLKEINNIILGNADASKASRAAAAAAEVWSTLR